MATPDYLINSSGIISHILNYATTNITGVESMTFFLIIGVLFLLCLLFRVPVIVASILIFPLIFGFMALTWSLAAVFGIILFFFAFYFVIQWRWM